MFELKGEHASTKRYCKNEPDLTPGLGKKNGIRETKSAADVWRRQGKTRRR